MSDRKISWTELAGQFDTHSMKQADKQWCLEEAIDIVKDAARGGAADLPQLLEELYAKLKELGADAWADSIRRRQEDGEKKELG